MGVHEVSMQAKAVDLRHRSSMAHAKELDASQQQMLAQESCFALSAWAVQVCRCRNAVQKQGSSGQALVSELEELEEVLEEVVD